MKYPDGAPLPVFIPYPRAMDNFDGIWPPVQILSRWVYVYKVNPFVDWDGKIKTHSAWFPDVLYSICTRNMRTRYSIRDDF